MTRTDPPRAATEKDMLVSFLGYYRETMIMMLDGLTEEQARWTPSPTANSLLGMVNHLTYVEEWWFHMALLGEPMSLPDIFAEDRDADFKPPVDQPIAFTVDRYREICARSNATTAATDLDQVCKLPRHADKGTTLRWILVHMVEEVARHAGHADITRELIDGKTAI